MSDQHEQDTWDQDEVEIVDLGAPDRGFSRYLFTLGEKWHAAAPLRARLIAPLVALGLLIAVLQPGSSGVIVQTHDTPRPLPTYPLPSTVYLIDCGTTININSSPDQVFIWEQVISTPSTQECNFSSRPGSQCPMPPAGKEVDAGCSVGTPSPAHSGNAGKNH